MTAPGPRDIGVDIGGTFTDFFAAGPDGIRTWKRLSTPDPAEAVLEGLAEAEGVSRVIHGSTVATNALLERRGPRTVLVTTRGFRDLLVIRRQERPSLYALEPQRTPHVVARGDVVEVDERLAADGTALTPLTEAEIERVVTEVLALEPGAVAVSLLFAFRQPEHEQRLAAALREAGLDVSASHEVMPEHREYERASTTAINAFLRPTVRRYLHAVDERTPALRVMHSGGGITSAHSAGELPVSMVLSGPAGGVLGALAVARAAGHDDIITLDMGGTSTDVALCTGEPRLRTSAIVDGLALHTPMIDMVTVGAGGGSIAFVDAGDALRVGPRSAGSVPGPACYGLGGAEPTVTDANVVLGRIDTGAPLGGGLTIDAAAATAALARLGEPNRIAESIVRVVNSNMASALRAVSLERGFDPRAFTLVAFGGAGPIHACELAAQLGIGRVLVPRYPGVLSALGMVTAAESVELSQGLLLRLDDRADGMLSEAATTLEATAREAFARTSSTDPAALEWSADARYAGQAHELRTAISEPRSGPIAEAFAASHTRRYGYDLPGQPVDLVSLRVTARAEARPLPLDPEQEGQAEPPEGSTHALWSEAGGATPATRHDRSELRPGMRFSGPALVTQHDATTVVPPGWAARVDAYSNLILEPADAS